MVYAGLPKGTVAFLTGLAAHNERDWFAAHRTEYDRDWLGAGLDLIAALSQASADLGLRAVPRLNASLRRIHRDVRFAKDKRPYEPHVHLILSSGAAFNRAPGVHLILGPDGIGYGAGVYGLSPAGLDAFRHTICDPTARAGFQALVAQAAQVGAVPDPPDLARVPKGFAAQAPWDIWLRRKSVIVRTPQPVPYPDWVFGAQAVAGWTGIVVALAPLCHWLVPFVAD
jgi:uncharacterized protein (TIGR02453 family)